MKTIESTLRALIVDDEESILHFLTETLERENYTVTKASSGEEALEHLIDQRFDVAILDLKLGGKVDGQRVLEAIRWRWPATIVVMLTAHGTLETTLDAIKEGVDGYLIKPVRPADVRKAIADAFYRREKIHESQRDQTEDQILEKGPYRVDLNRVTVESNGAEIDLSPREFKLLVHLMQSSPQVVGPKELVRVVRDYEPDHMNEAREIIKWYIHRLRKKIEPDPSKPRYILNVRGVGYRFAKQG